MGEVIPIHIGHCGSRIGSNFLKMISEEHGLDQNGVYCGQSDYQLDCISSFYCESKNNQYYSRAIFADLGPSAIDSVQAGMFGKIIQPSNIIQGRNGSSNIFAKGHYTEGPEYIPIITDSIRKEVEKCNNFQGFQFSHSIGGGTGSGLGTLVLSKLREEFPDRIFESFSVFPSPQHPELITEIYNAVLSMQHLIENTDKTIIFENEALKNICTEVLKIQTPNFQDYNNYISHTICDLTCCTRFPSQIDSDMRKLSVNLVPYPRMHFFISGFAPLVSNVSQSYFSPTVAGLISQVFFSKNFMCTANPTLGRYIAGCTIFRGNISSKEVDQEIFNVQHNKSSYFVEFVPSHIKTAICDVPPNNYKKSLTFIGNSSCINQIYSKLSEKFVAMFRKKTYLHWYTGEGMDEMEFTEAESNLNDLLSEYQAGNQTDVMPDEEEYIQD